MADINRLSADTLVLHHAVTPLWENKSKKELAQWFSDNGFVRAYGSNGANWSGLINPYTGARSYSQAHYAGQRVTKATPDATAAEKKAGYRLVPLVKDPWGQITWHAGHWNTNQRSIGIENLGDYRNYALRDGDCKVIADFWRSRDKTLGGKTSVLLHNEVYATACPARISEGRSKIVSYINNAPKPAPAPKPTPKPTPAPNLTWTKLSTPKTYKLNKNANLWNFDASKWGDVKSVKSFKKGELIDIFGSVKNKALNATYLVTKFSFESKTPNGFHTSDLDVYKAPEPKPVEPPKDDGKEAALASFLKSAAEWFEKFWNAKK